MNPLSIGGNAYEVAIAQDGGKAVLTLQAFSAHGLSFVLLNVAEIRYMAELLLAAAADIERNEGKPTPSPATDALVVELRSAMEHNPKLLLEEAAMRVWVDRVKALAAL